MKKVHPLRGSYDIQLDYKPLYCNSTVGFHNNSLDDSTNDDRNKVADSDMIRADRSGTGLLKVVFNDYSVSSY